MEYIYIYINEIQFIHFKTICSIIDTMNHTLIHKTCVVKGYHELFLLNIKYFSQSFMYTSGLKAFRVYKVFIFQ